MIDFNDAPLQQDERERPEQAPDDPIQAFISTLISFNLEPPEIVPDGRLHRFDDEKRGKKAAWYVFHYGDICGAAFGNWRTGLNETWCSKDSRKLTDAEAAEYQRIIKAAQKARKEVEKELNEKARERAIEIIKKSGDPAPDHAYLKRKNIKPHKGMRQINNALVLPISDASGKLWSVQEIYPDGRKHFPFGTKKKRNSFTIPGNETLYICEGYATGASIHEATLGTVIIAFDAGNLLSVAKEVRKQKPHSQIVICADNDLFTAGNPGITKGKEAAKAIDAILAFPTFENIETKPTDFNDLQNLEGLEAVKKQINVPNVKPPFPPFTAEMSNVKSRLTKRPEPLEFVFHYHEQGLIPKGVVGVLVATGGTGKTYFFLSLAYAGAAGGKFGPIRAERPMNTLVVIGEDTQAELDRRLWDVGKGQFPECLHAVSVYGEVGPLMRLDGNLPVRADGFHWLEETIQGHPGLEVLFLDPKSRFYGLDENNNDNSTQWIQSLEYLAKRYDLTILFSNHTGKDNADRISQKMSRGGSAIVDGCRWQGGLVRMDSNLATKFGIEDRRNYVVFDVPKSNYAADLPSQIYFKRDLNGVLNWVDPYQDKMQNMGAALLEILKNDPSNYSRLDLEKEKDGKDIAREMKEKFPSFKRSKDMKAVINYLIETEKIYEALNENTGRGRAKLVLFVMS